MKDPEAMGDAADDSAAAGAIADSWGELRRFTPARLALGRSGDSLPTAAWLQFSLAHAQARDAVRVQLDVPGLERQLLAAGFASFTVHSAARDAAEYLRRPDAGRRLDERSSEALRTAAQGRPAHSLAVVIGDGLSAWAVQRHALPVLCELRARVADLQQAAVIVAVRARVALGDEIGALLQAEQVIVLIGERPGLSSHDSLGIYFTYAPRVGRSDAERNCISNVRPEGLSYAQAAHRLAFLMAGARRLGRSGTALKDESAAPLLARTASERP